MSVNDASGLLNGTMQSASWIAGLTEQAVYNLFITVVDPSQDTTHKFPSQNHGKAYVVLGVEVEAPLTCTYEYNLRIFDDVHVGKLA
jgi:hypothetical protein